MGLLIDGKWSAKWYEPDEKGRFVRSESKFRNAVKADGSTEFEPAAGRYHLYVSYACPWAHRTLIMRKLKGLERAISVSVVQPFMGDNGWEFGDYPNAIPDIVNHKDRLYDVYLAADPGYTGRVTVPVLWDKQKNTIVNNESRELLRMFDHEFNNVAADNRDYCPPELKAQIEETIDAIYTPINNGVYRSGFAVTQDAYDEAVAELFAALDHWETVLGQQRFLCGDRLTEADFCLFPTLYRFDTVYHYHFKCNIRRILDYPNLWRFVRDVYQYKGIRETCFMDHIKRHYYTSHPSVNPHRVIPRGPIINFDEPLN